MKAIIISYSPGNMTYLNESEGSELSLIATTGNRRDVEIKFRNLDNFGDITELLESEIDLEIKLTVTPKAKSHTITLK